MTHRSRCSLVVLLAVSLAACATGSDPGPPSQPPRAVEGERVHGPDPGVDVVEALPEPEPAGKNRLDFDGDAHVDREEFRNFFARVFHSLDGDDDRVLGGPELAGLPADSVRQADANRDGALDVAEYVDMALVWFDRCDANRDDVLGPDEEARCD